jgi:group II intron reverse transcriptase/maturase
VFEADIRKFYDSIDHGWLMRMVEHRIADPRILRLIGQWLAVGVLEDGVYAETVEGTPQGAGISPLLANIFLHYALDLWVEQWARRTATGRMRLVRYADDFLLTFERRTDAERMAAALAERLAKFGLRLHEAKTRLIEFGRFAATNRLRRSEDRPETFDFLGFTHYCGKTLDGRFMVHRNTQRGRMVRKLKELRLKLKRRRHTPIREQHSWLSRVLRGNYAYYGVTDNTYGLRRFLSQAVRAWHAAIRRRSQNAECHGIVSMLSYAPNRYHRRGSFMSGAVARPETGLLARRAGCGKAASPDLWGRRRVTATLPDHFLEELGDRRRGLRQAVRSPSFSSGFLTSRGPPSGRLVSFVAICGTTPRSVILSAKLAASGLPSASRLSHNLREQPTGLLRFR